MIPSVYGDQSQYFTTHNQFQQSFLSPSNRVLDVLGDNDSRSIQVRGVPIHRMTLLKPISYAVISPDM